MASLSGNYREGAFATIAAADTGLDAWITALDARFQVIAGGDLATRANGNFALSVKCENAAGDEYTFKHNVTFDTGVQGAGVPDASCITIVTALAALATAVEGASAYTTVVEVMVTGSLSISN